MNISLVHVKPDGSSREVSLTSFPRTVGRGADCEVRIPVGSVSRRHCQVWLDEEEDALMVKDLGSSNGTFVNGQRTSEAELSPGDLLTIGPTVFVVRMDGFPVDIDAADSYAKGSDGEAGTVGGDEAGSGTKTATPVIPPRGLTSSDESSMIDFDFDLDDDDDQPSL